MARLFVQRKAVSSVLGAVISIGILLTAVVPLIVYMQTTNAVYNESIADRRQKDYELMVEEISATDYVSGGRIWAFARNTGPLTAKIVRYWVVDLEDADLCEPTVASWTLNTGDGVTVDTGVAVVAGRGYVVKFVTERGNIVVANPSPLYVTGSETAPGTTLDFYPFSITVDIKAVGEKGGEVENRVFRVEAWNSSGELFYTTRAVTGQWDWEGESGGNTTAYAHANIGAIPDRYTVRVYDEGHGGLQDPVLVATVTDIWVDAANPSPHVFCNVWVSG